MSWREHIVSDPRIYHGQVCIEGTQVPVSVVLDNLAAGVSEDEILREYPFLGEDSIRASVAYAAELARERVSSLTA